MARAKRYWLLKCEPEAYTIDDLERDGVTEALETVGDDLPATFDEPIGERDQG